MSNEPVRRLIDDPDAPPDLRQHVERVAAAPVVDYDASAGLERLKATLAAPPPVVKLGWTVKIVSGVVLAIGAGALIRYFLTHDNAIAPAPPTVTVVAPVAPTATASTIETFGVPIDSLPRVSEPPHATVPTSPLPSSVPAPSASASPDSLREEMQNLADVRRAAADDPARAVDLADRGNARFGHGVLYQEREAIAITSLAKLGRKDDSERRARAFLSEFPDGPLADRVRAVTARNK